MRKLMSFGLKNGMAYGVATEEDIQEMCSSLETEVYKQELASYEDVEEYMCLGRELPTEEFLEVQEGYIIIIGGEIDFYDKKEVCKPMLSGILETYFV